MDIARTIFEGLFLFCLLMGFFVIDGDKTPRLRFVNWTACIAALAVAGALYSLK
jgi:hypothetical protein